MAAPFISYVRFLLGEPKSSEAETRHSLLCCFVEMKFEFKAEEEKNLPGSLEPTTSDTGVKRPGLPMHDAPVRLE